jgi:hypothetical protein
MDNTKLGKDITHWTPRSNMANEAFHLICGFLVAFSLRSLRPYSAYHSRTWVRTPRKKVPNRRRIVTIKRQSRAGSVISNMLGLMRGMMRAPIGGSRIRSLWTARSARLMGLRQIKLPTMSRWHVAHGNFAGYVVVMNIESS